MTYTSHGHHIPTSPQDDEEHRPPVARCGGTHICKVCGKEFAAYLASKEADMSQYESRPSVANAKLLDADNAEQVASWCGGEVKGGQLRLPTLNGVELVAFGRYVVRTQGGQFMSMSQERFDEAFKPIEDSNMYERSIESEEDLQALNQRRGFQPVSERLLGNKE